MHKDVIVESGVWWNLWGALTRFRTRFGQR